MNVCMHHLQYWRLAWLACGFTPEISLQWTVLLRGCGEFYCEDKGKCCTNINTSTMREKLDQRVRKEIAVINTKFVCGRMKRARFAPRSWSSEGFVSFPSCVVLQLVCVRVCVCVRGSTGCVCVCACFGTEPRGIHIRNDCVQWRAPVPILNYTQMNRVLFSVPKRYYHAKSARQRFFLANLRDSAKLVAVHFGCIACTVENFTSRNWLHKPGGE